MKIQGKYFMFVWEFEGGDRSDHQLRNVMNFVEFRDFFYDKVRFQEEIWY